MAIIELKKQVNRVVTTEKGTRVIAEFTPLGVQFRYPRTRTRWLLPWGKALGEAYWLAAERRRMEKERARKAKKLAKSGR